MRRLALHIRHNAVAYIALFVALGGTSYAAVEISNHSLTPAKLNPRLFGGYVRGWVSVSAGGRVISSTGGLNVVVQHSAPAGNYVVHWRTTPTTGCVSIADVDRRGIGFSGPLPGYALPEATGRAGRAEESVVQTYGAQGQREALPFDVALLCSTPR